MKYTVKNAVKSGEWEGKYGKNYDYALMLTDESGTEVFATLSQKPETAVPQPGETIDGTIEDKGRGPKFIKERLTGFGGGRQEDPARQASIERQNALTNAIAYCTAKASMMDKIGALDYYTGKQIIQVATYFAKYNKGEVTVVTEAKGTTEPAQPQPTKSAFQAGVEKGLLDANPDVEIDLDGILGLEE